MLCSREGQQGAGLLNEILSILGLAVGTAFLSLMNGLSKVKEYPSLRLSF